MRFEVADLWGYGEEMVRNTNKHTKAGGIEIRLLSEHLKM